MKRFFLLISVLLLACSCQQEKDIQNENILKEFRAALSDLEVKSITMPGSGKTSWEKGDEVLVDNGSELALFVYNSSRDVFVTERDDFESASSYKAIFPASACLEDSGSGDIRISVPAEQKLYPNYIKDLVMVAEAEADSVFCFQSLFSVVRLDFPADRLPQGSETDLTKVEFTSAQADVAGIASVKDSTFTFVSDNQKKITFDCSEKTVGVGTPLYIAIPAQTYQGGFSVDFTFADNSTFSLSCTEDVTAMANTVSLTRLLTPWAAFSGGEGTAESPYIIKSIADYQEFVERSAAEPEFLSRHYRLDSDLDLKGLWIFQPVGNAEAPFSGVFDADGHSISGVVYRTEAGGRPTAMFGYTDGAVIRNLKLDGWNVTSKAQYLGGIAAVARNTTFENCEWNGQLHQSVRAPMEGFESVTDNANMGFTGGIAAMAEGCTFSGCVFNGQISATGKNIGGIAGYARKTSMTKCSATKASEIYTTYHCAGSMAGAMTQNSLISECSTAGKVASFDHCGGIVGYLQSGKVEKCVVSSSAMISGRQFNIGGIAGFLIPKNEETASIDRCTVYSDITGQYNVGGIVGHIDCNDTGGKCHITNCTYKEGILRTTGTNGSKYSLVGGITGWMTKSSEIVIENCVTAPKFIRTGIQQAAHGALNESIGGTGGLFGFNNNDKTTYVSNCYTTVTLSEIQHSYKPVTGFADYKIWGLAAGRNANTIVLNEAKNFFNADNEGRGIADGQVDANLEGLTGAQMTDGTLLNRLNAATASLQLASEVVMSGWTATSGGYPALECEIADPQPRDNSAKRVSVIGDSISSFAGYIPAGYNYHYPCADGSVTRVEQTYWWQLIYEKMSNARLDINMSYSGTAVANSDDARDNKTDHWVNNSFVERFIRLGGIGDPDIVLIHGGTNDWAHGDNCPLYPGSKDCHDEPTPSADILKAVYALADAAQTREEIEALPHNDFCSAYVKLLCLIRQQYPDTKIVCIIGDYLSEGIERSIISIANHYGAKSVDLLAVNGFNDQTYMPKHDYNGSSGCHPNAKAMTFIADKIYEDLGAWLEQ